MATRRFNKHNYYKQSVPRQYEQSAHIQVSCIDVDELRFSSGHDALARSADRIARLREAFATTDGPHVETPADTSSCRESGSPSVPTVEDELRELTDAFIALKGDIDALWETLRLAPGGAEALAARCDFYDRAGAQSCRSAASPAPRTASGQREEGPGFD